MYIERHRSLYCCGVSRSSLNFNLFCDLNISCICFANLPSQAILSGKETYFDEDVHYRSVLNCCIKQCVLDLMSLRNRICKYKINRKNSHAAPLLLSFRNGIMQFAFQNNKRESYKKKFHTNEPYLRH